MEVAELQAKSKRVRQAYNVANRLEGYKVWGRVEYLQGLVGDVGDLSKLVLASRGFAFAQKDVHSKLARELADCLLALFALADEFDLDLGQESEKTLARLEEKLKGRQVLAAKMAKSGHRV